MYMHFTKFQAFTKSMKLTTNHQDPYLVLQVVLVDDT